MFYCFLGVICVRWESLEELSPLDVSNVCLAHHDSLVTVSTS